MGYGLLSKKKGIIFGALNDESIAWKVCKCCYDEGADMVITNSPLAIDRIGKIKDLAKENKFFTIRCRCYICGRLDGFIQEVFGAFRLKDRFRFALCGDVKKHKKK